MLENILSRLDGESTANAVYTVFYGASQIRKFDSYEEAEIWAGKCFSRKDLVRIEKEGESNVADN